MRDDHRHYVGGLRTTVCAPTPGRGAARCAGQADQDTDAVDESHTTAKFARRYSVHAGYDHAPCSSD